MKKILLIATAIVAVLSFQAEAREAAELYNKTCVMCHGTGAAGAPLVHNVEQWKPRVDQGMDTMLTHAKNGLNAMPPMGMCMDCTDDEFKSIIEYMSQAK